MAMLSFERKYRVRGGTLIGGDLFDFWVGPFYVGFFGVTTIFFALARHRADRLRRGARADLEPLADQHRPARPEVRPRPRAAAGGRAVADHHHLRASAPSSPGRCAQVEICRKLGMGYHVPVRLRLRDLRLRHAGGDPAGAAGRLGARLPLRHLQPPRLGVEHRLPVPALPLQSGAHARGELLLHDDASRCRCTARWSCRRPTRRRASAVKTSEHENTFFRDTIGYSIGTLGIHRLGPVPGAARPASGARSASSSAARSGPAAGRNGGAGGSTCRSGARARARTMAEYQNIFTQVQVRGPAYAGVPLDARRPGSASGKPGFIYWLGQDRRRAGRADLPRLARPRLAHLRLHRHRDHRAQHVGLGELGPGPVRPPAALAGARAAAARPTACSIPPLNEGGWWLMAGFFLTASILLWWAAHLPPRPGARHGHARRLGLRRARSGSIWCSASSARS